MMIDRVLRWVAAAGTTIITAVIISGIGTWDTLKAQAIRMESVPADVKAIRELGAKTANKVDHLQWRIDGMEKAIYAPKSQ